MSDVKQVQILGCSFECGKAGGVSHVRLGLLGRQAVFERLGNVVENCGFSNNAASVFIVNMR